MRAAEAKPRDDLFEPVKLKLLKPANKSDCEAHQADGGDCSSCHVVIELHSIVIGLHKDVDNKLQQIQLNTIQMLKNENHRTGNKIQALSGLVEGLISELNTKEINEMLKKHLKREETAKTIEMWLLKSSISAGFNFFLFVLSLGVLSLLGKHFQIALPF
jgi:hypothetical protein